MGNDPEYWNYRQNQRRGKGAENSGDGPSEGSVKIIRSAVGPNGETWIIEDSYTQEELTDLIAPRLKYLIEAHGTKISPEALAGHVASTIINRDEP